MTDAMPFALLRDAARRFEDTRGFLEVLYEHDNLVLKRSFSRAGVFRGMHWQKPPYAQTKLIRVVSGQILDCVVDPRLPSPELLCRELSPGDGWVKIDAHWAHGFYALEDVEFEYICHGAYNEAAESCFSVVDALVRSMGLRAPILSAKDAAAPVLSVSAVENRL